MNRDHQFLLDMLLSAKIAVSYIKEKSKIDLEADADNLYSSNSNSEQIELVL